MIWERIRGERRDEPRLLYCEIDKDIPKGCRYGPVIRDVFIIESCVEGGGTVVINGEPFSISVGQAIVLLPGDSVEMYADSVTSRRCLWCAVDGLALGAAFARGGITSHNPYIPRGCVKEVTDVLRRMVEMREDNDGGADFRRTALVYELLGAILRPAVITDKHNTVLRAIAFMETNYHLDISVSDIARAVFLDRSYFSTLFKAETGTTPYAYLCSLRIRKACVLMKEQGYSVSAAAESVGIDSDNFARLFKKIIGMTPREYLLLN